MWAIGQGGVLSVRCIGLRLIAFSESELGERGRFLFPFLVSRVLSGLLTLTALAGGNGA